MDIVDLDEKLGIRVFAGMAKRLMSLGAIWIVGLALPHERPIDWSLVRLALLGFVATGVILSWIGARSVAHHSRLDVVFSSMFCSYLAITAVYIERGDVNNPAVMLFSAPLIYEAVARRGPLYFAIPMAFAIGGYVGGGIYLGAEPIQVLTNTWYVIGFMVVLYMLVTFLVGEVRKAAAVANAIARVGAVVANASSSRAALALAETDICLITGADSVALFEADDGPQESVQGPGEGITFASTGRQLVFRGRSDRDQIKTVSNLFQMLEQRQLIADQLHTQSVTDPLTGIGNRRMLDSVANQLSSSVTAVMLDLDHFKQFNDDNGHGAGDELLVDFAAVLAQSVRADDVLVRYGGEEFCLVLSCDEATALARIEAVRTAWVAHREGVTFSAGIASLGEQETLGSAIDRADAALYRAKHDGRDQSMVDQI